MLELDLNIVSVAIGVVASLCGAFAIAVRTVARFDDIPDRVAALEEKQAGLDVVSDVIDRVEAVSDCQMAMLEGQMNLFHHIIDGGDPRDLQSSYDEMVMKVMDMKSRSKRKEK